MNPVDEANSKEWWDQRWLQLTANLKEKPHQSPRSPLIASMIPRNATVLDVASGPGAIAPLLHRTVRYTRLDHSISALRWPAGPAILADVNHLPIKPATFHTVMATEILEHLQQPETLLAAITAIATHQLILSVPNDRLKPPHYKWHAQGWNRNTFRLFLARNLDAKAVHLHLQIRNIIAHCIL